MHSKLDSKKSRHMTAPLKIQISQLIEAEPLEIKGKITETAQALDLPHPQKWSSLDYHLTALRTGEECLVRGTIDTVLTRACERCLEDLPMPIEVDFVHSYDCKENVAIDLTPEAREDILLGLPIAFRCELNEDGQCPNTGKEFRDGANSLDDAWQKSTWQALDQLEEK